MAETARAGQLSEQWLQDYVNVKLAQTKRMAQVQTKKRFEGTMR